MHVDVMHMSCRCHAHVMHMLELKKHQDSSAAESSAHGTAPKGKLCEICYATLRDPDLQNESLPCGHTYHAECIRQFSSVQGVHHLDVPCPVCKLVPSVLISEARVKAFESGQESEPILGVGQDSRGGVVVDLQSSPVSVQGSSTESVPEPEPAAEPEQNQEPGQNQEPETAPQVNPETKYDRQSILKNKNLLRKPKTKPQKKPASSSNSKPDVAKAEVAKPKVAKPAASSSTSKGASSLHAYMNSASSKPAASEGAQVGWTPGGLFNYFSPFPDTSQDAHGGSRKRMRAKTHDDSLPPAAPPATKKQQAAEEKEEVEAAQKKNQKNAKKKARMQKRRKARLHKKTNQKTQKRRRGCRKGGRRG